MTKREDLEKRVALIKMVFGGPKGQELLELLSQETAIRFSPDPSTQAYIVGKHELIQELIAASKLTKEDVVALTEGLDTDFNVYDDDI